MARLLHPSEIFASWWYTVQSPTQPVPVERDVTTLATEVHVGLRGVSLDP